MKKTIEWKWSAVVLAALLCCVASFAANTPQKPEKSLAEEVAKNSFRYGTSDLLSWEGKFFWMSRTPLSIFKGYLDLYNEHPSDFTIMTVGKPGFEKRYSILWKILDNKLFITKITLQRYNEKNIEQFYPNDSISRIMETFTNEKFMKITKDSRPCIFARWFNGEINIKKELIFNWGDDQEKKTKEWEKLPYYTLTFKEGELISNTLINPSENGK